VRLWVILTIRLLKHKLSDFIKIAFFDAQDAEYDFIWPLKLHVTTLHRLNESRFLRCPDGRLLFLRPIRLIKASFIGLQKMSLFSMSTMRYMISRGLITPSKIASSTSLKPFLKTSRSHEFLGPFFYLTALKRLRPGRFLDAMDPKMFSQVLSSPWNIASRTSPKSV
jgi:hypothetical protein